MSPEAMRVATGWDCHVHVFDRSVKVAAGHYAPQDHSLATIEEQAAQHGFDHLVLVQPSVYSTDNSVLLAALQVSDGRHRGVVVVDELLSDAQLQQWHEWGVRGIRCNLVSPVGNQIANWAEWTPRLKALGWHVQWYAQARQLPQVLAWQQHYQLPCVLDHVAGMQANAVQDDAAWQSLQALADVGAWIKLSGWYRLGLVAPYNLAQLRLPQIVAMFEGRCVWGSDWPHTSFEPNQAPSYAQVWQPLQALLGVTGVDQLRSQAHVLYAN